MYKYLIFDLDETLFDFKAAEAKAITTVLNKNKIIATQQTVELYSKINLSCWKRYEKGEICREDIYKQRVLLLGDALGVDFNVDEFSIDYFSALAHQGQTFEYALPLLKSLKNKGYKMAAATNGALIAQTGRIVNSGLAGFFDSGIYISEQVGYKKPEPEFFEHIIEKLGIHTKADALVIGDSPSSDIAGAKAVKLDCCLVDLRKQYDKTQINPTYYVNRLEDIIPVCKL